MNIVNSILAEADTVLQPGTTSYTSVKDNYTYRIGYELATGGAEGTKVKNIYDLAGNMYEWTAEHGEHKDYLTGNKDSDGLHYSVIRGCSFANAGYNTPISYRHGAYNNNYGDLTIGFRVMLYVK